MGIAPIAETARTCLNFNKIMPKRKHSISEEEIIRRIKNIKITYINPKQNDEPLSR